MLLVATKIVSIFFGPLGQLDKLLTTHFQMSKQELKELISEGSIQEAIDALKKQTKDGSEKLHNAVILQQSNWSELQIAQLSGTNTKEAQEHTSQQIKDSLLKIIDEVFKTAKKKRLAWWKYVVGAGVIVGIIAGIVTTLKHLGYLESQSNKSSNIITVLAHGPEGKDDLVLPNRGLVYLIYGDDKRAEEVNGEGEATFKQISEKHFLEGAKVELLFEDPLGEPYRARYPDSLYQLTKEQYLDLEVVLEGMDYLEGIVKDFNTGEPLDSVLVRITGHSFYSNQFGEFTIDIPQERQQQFIDISLSKPGYSRKELTQVPTTNGQIQKIALKPKN